VFAQPARQAAHAPSFAQPAPSAFPAPPIAPAAGWGSANTSAPGFGAQPPAMPTRACNGFGAAQAPAGFGSNPFERVAFISPAHQRPPPAAQQPAVPTNVFGAPFAAPFATVQPQHPAQQPAVAAQTSATAFFAAPFAAVQPQQPQQPQPQQPQQAAANPFFSTAPQQAPQARRAAVRVAAQPWQQAAAPSNPFVNPFAVAPAVRPPTPAWLQAPAVQPVAAPVPVVQPVAAPAPAQQQTPSSAYGSPYGTPLFADRPSAAFPDAALLAGPRPLSPLPLAASPRTPLAPPPMRHLPAAFVSHRRSSLSPQPARYDDVSSGSATPSAVTGLESLMERSNPRALFIREPERSTFANAVPPSMPAPAAVPSTSTQQAAEPEVWAHAAPPSRLPTLSRLDYYCSPSIDELAAAEAACPGSLRSVYNFVVGIHGGGAVRFLAPVDLSDGPALDALVTFSRRNAGVYPGAAAAPPVGTGLNVPAEVMLRGVWSTKAAAAGAADGDAAAAAAAFRAKLCAAEGTRFVSYEPVEGVWRFRVAHF
jgi:hypothetical protein